MCVDMCSRVRVRACVYACVRKRVRACVYARVRVCMRDVFAILKLLSYISYKSDTLMISLQRVYRLVDDNARRKTAQYRYAQYRLNCG